MHKYIQYLLILSSALTISPAAAQAQTSLDSFLGKVQKASELPDCVQTQAALENIPDSEFNAALADIQNVRSQDDLNLYKDKFAAIRRLASKCPETQDKFANKLSLLAMHAQLKQRRANPDHIRDFVKWCESAIQAGDCTKSASALSKFPKDMCRNAIDGFRNVPPSAFGDEEYQKISESMGRVMSWSDACPEYHQIYQACLTPESTKYEPIEKLDPFFAYLHALKKEVRSARCEALNQIKIDPAAHEKASASIKGLSPAQFSPADRAKIQDAMRDVYEAGKSCPGAHAYIDSAIEKMFSGK